MGQKTNYSPTFPMFPAGAAAITANDAVDLPQVSVVFVGGAGNVKVTTANGDDVTFSGVAAGMVLPVQVRRVWSTGTTATLMTAIY